MQLQTHVPLSLEKNTIDYGSKTLLLGSCFAENIGNKLRYYQFQHQLNPFGIMFHPLAIEQLICRAINNTSFTEEDLLENEGYWFCLEVHSSITASSAAELLTKLNERLSSLQTYLMEATHVIFTFGTAWVYRYIPTDAVVANCHKIPQKKFLKELLSSEEVAASIERAQVLLHDINPKASLIYTVSPVRHLKDGFVENTRSKAQLVSGIHQVVDSVRNTFYFPSYELMMDELRDYRFYAEDMLHPNTLAIQYIWEKFSSVWIDPRTATLQKEIEIVQKGIQHRAFQPDSASHQQFRRQLQERIKKIQQQLPHANFS